MSQIWPRVSLRLGTWATGLPEQSGFVEEGGLWKRVIPHEDLAETRRGQKRSPGHDAGICWRCWLLSGIQWLPGDDRAGLAWVRPQGSSFAQAGDWGCHYFHSISYFHQEPLKSGEGGRWGRRMSSLGNLGDGGSFWSCSDRWGPPETHREEYVGKPGAGVHT